MIAFAVSADEVPFDLTLLPEAETLSQHLFSSAFWSTTNKEGYISTNISPVGPELFIGGVALGVGASLFLVGRTSESRGMDEGQEIIEEPVEMKPKLMKKWVKGGARTKKGEAKKEVKKIK